MTDEEWSHWFSPGLGLQLAGDAIAEMSDEGLPITDDTFLILLNAHDEPVPFVLPDHDGGAWEPVLDTRDWQQPIADGRRFKEGEPYPLEGRALAVLRLHPREFP